MCETDFLCSWKTFTCSVKILVSWNKNFDKKQPSFIHTVSTYALSYKQYPILLFWLPISPELSILKDKKP